MSEIPVKGKLSLWWLMTLNSVKWQMGGICRDCHIWKSHFSIKHITYICQFPLTSYLLNPLPKKILFKNSDRYDGPIRLQSKSWKFENNSEFWHYLYGSDNYSCRRNIYSSRWNIYPNDRNNYSNRRNNYSRRRYNYPSCRNNYPSCRNNYSQYPVGYPRSRFCYPHDRNSARKSGLTT